MKRLFIFIACFIIACTSLAFVGCKNNNDSGLSFNITQNLPNKVHIEYGNIVYVKDGNDIYARSGVYSMSGRSEVYVREHLSDGVFYWQGSGQHYISARWTGSAWERADQDSLGYEGWNSNDMNHSVIYGRVNNVQGPDTSGYMLHGYSDVNSLLDSMTETKLSNQMLRVGENNVECEVWETVFEYGDTYEKCKYWFAADSHIYLKGLWTQDRAADIDTDGSNYGMPEATYYAVGESMADFLASLDPARTIPDFSPWH